MKCMLFLLTQNTPGVRQGGCYRKVSTEFSVIQSLESFNTFSDSQYWLLIRITTEL